MALNIKCSECGFLDVRHRKTRQLREAEPIVREQGYLLIDDPVTGSTAYDKCPECFVHAFNFKNELGWTPNEDRVKLELHKLRSCEEFTPWISGSSPKEHKEMLAEIERQKWEAKREEADRADREEMRRFQAEQAQLSREHNTESLAIANRSSWIALCGVIVAVLGLSINTAIGFLRPPIPVTVNPAIMVPSDKLPADKSLAPAGAKQLPQ